MKPRTKEEFMLRFRSVKAHILVRALNRLTPGISWTGCPKGHIAEAWAKAEVRSYTRLNLVELSELEKEIKEVMGK